MNTTILSTTGTPLNQQDNGASGGYIALAMAATKPEPLPGDRTPAIGDALEQRIGDRRVHNHSSPHRAQPEAEDLALEVGELSLGALILVVADLIGSRRLSVHPQASCRRLTPDSDALRNEALVFSAQAL